MFGYRRIRWWEKVVPCYANQVAMVLSFGGEVPVLMIGGPLNAEQADVLHRYRAFTDIRSYVIQYPEGT